MYNTSTRKAKSKVYAKSHIKPARYKPIVSYVFKPHPSRIVPRKMSSLSSTDPQWICTCVVLCCHSCHCCNSVQEKSANADKNGRSGLLVVAVVVAVTVTVTLLVASVQFAAVAVLPAAQPQH